MIHPGEAYFAPVVPPVNANSCAAGWSPSQLFYNEGSTNNFKWIICTNSSGTDQMLPAGGAFTAYSADAEQNYATGWTHNSYSCPNGWPRIVPFYNETDSNNGSIELCQNNTGSAQMLPLNIGLGLATDVNFNCSADLTKTKYHYEAGSSNNSVWYACTSRTPVAKCGTNIVDGLDCGGPKPDTATLCDAGSLDGSVLLHRNVSGDTGYFFWYCKLGSAPLQYCKIGCTY